MTMLSGMHGTLARPPSHDRLDEMLRVSNPLSWVALVALSTALVAALVWSCLGTAAVKVEGQGILLSTAGVVDIGAPADGRLVNWRVGVGDVVRAGDTIAEVAQPEQSERLQAKLLELDGLRAERQQLASFQTHVTDIQTKLTLERKEGLESRIASLNNRLASLHLLQDNTQMLVERGIATRTRILEVTNERIRTENDLAEARSMLVQLAAETEGRTSQNARELLNIAMRIDGTQREIAVLRSTLTRSTSVVAEVGGRVIEVIEAPGEMVRAGAPLLRMLPARDGVQDSLSARLYVPGGDGKRVKIGMEVQLVPATARLQRDGFINGRVIHVADLPTTRESMVNTLKNSALVETLTSKGAPYEILVELERDPTSPSGFLWSTGRGMSLPPEGGTIAEAKFVVDRIPLIALVIPRAETVLGWMRL
ncbi:NHLP bacteriocin system secretion protein [Aquabacter sp. CN5-332]|uniref:NHLP bacteriocin system secretion protein n=1 Tax=Aquabacter sp. CN5-332 TaxID=3156608 RepID=UPI0032B5254D